MPQLSCPFYRSTPSLPLFNQFFLYGGQKILSPIRLSDTFFVTQKNVERRQDCPLELKHEIVSIIKRYTR